VFSHLLPLDGGLGSLKEAVVAAAQAQARQILRDASRSLELLEGWRNALLSRLGSEGSGEIEEEWGEGGGGGGDRYLPTSVLSKLIPHSLTSADCSALCLPVSTPSLLLEAAEALCETEERWCMLQRELKALHSRGWKVACYSESSSLHPPLLLDTGMLRDSSPSPSPSPTTAPENEEEEEEEEEEDEDEEGRSSNNHDDEEKEEEKYVGGGCRVIAVFDPKRRGCAMFMRMPGPGASTGRTGAWLLLPPSSLVCPWEREALRHFVGAVVGAIEKVMERVVG
jgi:hypothetical protein